MVRDINSSYIEYLGGERLMFDRELVKGSTSLLVLYLLNEKDMYGYQLAKQLEKRSGQTLQIKEGTLYPALKKLESKGYVSSYWVDQESGPARKYYSLTDDGREVLRIKALEWAKFSETIDTVLGRLL